MIDGCIGNWELGVLWGVFHAAMAGFDTPAASVAVIFFDYYEFNVLIFSFSFPGCFGYRAVL